MAIPALIVIFTIEARDFSLGPQADTLKLGLHGFDCRARLVRLTDQAIELLGYHGSRYAMHARSLSGSTLMLPTAAIPVPAAAPPAGTLAAVSPTTISSPAAAAATPATVSSAASMFVSSSAGHSGDGRCSGAQGRTGAEEAGMAALMQTHSEGGGDREGSARRLMLDLEAEPEDGDVHESWRDEVGREEGLGRGSAGVKVKVKADGKEEEGEGQGDGLTPVTGLPSGMEPGGWAELNGHFMPKQVLPGMQLMLPDGHGHGHGDGSRADPGTGAAARSAWRREAHEGAGAVAAAGSRDNGASDQEETQAPRDGSMEGTAHNHTTTEPLT